MTTSTRPKGRKRKAPQKTKRFAALPILMVVTGIVLAVAIAMGCGIIGGSGVTRGGIAESEGTIDPENLENISDESDAEGETEGDSESESEGEEGDGSETTETEPEAGAEPESEPEPAPVAAEEPPAPEDPAAADPETPVDDESVAEPEPTVSSDLVQGADLAWDLAWVHLSQCVTLNSTELTATLISADWFIAGSADATRAYGFWKVESATGAVTPYDTLSRQWQTTLDAQCSAESLEAVEVVARAQTAVVSTADDAVATIWSFLSRCNTDLNKEIFEATNDPAQGEWVVVTKSDSLRQFGTWRVAKLTGDLKPYAGLAEAWNSTVALACSAESMTGLVSPTPTPIVKDIVEAVTNLWAHLVKCAPAMTVDDWQATWNPVNNEWVIVTKAAVTVDYGVWVVRKDGSIIAENREAVAGTRKLFWRLARLQGWQPQAPVFPTVGALPLNDIFLVTEHSPAMG